MMFDFVGGSVDLNGVSKITGESRHRLGLLIEGFRKTLKQVADICMSEGDQRLFRGKVL